MKSLTLYVRFFCLCLCFMTVGRMPAQNELSGHDFLSISDTISVKPTDEIKYNQQILPSNLNSLVYPKLDYKLVQPLHTSLPPLLNTTERYLEQIFTPGSAVIAVWQEGAFTVAGHINNMPGLMGIASGHLGITQRFGNLTLYVGGAANKYGFFGGLHTQYGIEANAHYHLSPRWSVNARGWYYPSTSLPTISKGLIVPMSIIGYIQPTQFRLAANYQVNSWLDVETGAKLERLYGSNQFETSPVVTPYFSFGSGNHKVRIGIPVGEIMYKLLRNYTNNDNKGRIINLRPTRPGLLLR